MTNVVASTMERRDGMFHAYAPLTKPPPQRLPDGSLLLREFGLLEGGMTDNQFFDREVERMAKAGVVRLKVFYSSIVLGEYEP